MADAFKIMSEEELNKLFPKGDDGWSEHPCDWSQCGEKGVFLKMFLFTSDGDKIMLRLCGHHYNEILEMMNKQCWEREGIM